MQNDKQTNEQLLLDMAKELELKNKKSESNRKTRKIKQKYVPLSFCLRD